MKLIKRFLLGEGQTNCYLIEVNDKIVLIDAGQNPAKLINYVKEQDLTIDEIWITHTHFDHIMGIQELVDEFSVNKVYVSPKEQSFFKLPEENLSKMANFSFQYFGKVNEITDRMQEENNVQVFYIQGHSAQGAVYYFAEEKIAFTGDVLFRGTIGRSDFRHGNQQLLVKGIRDYLFTLDETTKIYPGHGFSTTIANEKRENLYLKEINER